MYFLRLFLRLSFRGETSGGVAICRLFSQGDNLSQVLSTSGNMKTRLLAAFVSFFIKLCGSDFRKGLGERRTFFLSLLRPSPPPGI